MQKAEKRFSGILKKIKNSNIPVEQLGKLDIVSKLCTTKETKPKRKFAGVFVCVFLSLAVYVCKNFRSEPECLLDMPIDASKIFREPEDCKLCEGVVQVDKVKNITGDDFEKNYFLPAKPVVVIDGTRGWNATKTFDFDFFKKLYANVSDVTKNECQFFPYKTEFKSLREVFSMKPERAKLEPGEKPWYVGWSNCNDNVGKILKEYYTRPYFLPETSENMALNWIFMGGPGFGAHMHVDNVQFPSWQAQLSGRKLWRLAPPPECLYRCKNIDVVVEPGEIIVVDTNRWYHQTQVLPGDISITIGSEFD